MSEFEPKNASYYRRELTKLRAELAALKAELQMRRKGECICIKCGLRQEGEHVSNAEF